VATNKILIILYNRRTGASLHAWLRACVGNNVERVFVHNVVLAMEAADGANKRVRSLSYKAAEAATMGAAPKKVRGRARARFGRDGEYKKSSCTDGRPS
jgi:hypothetical protein